MATDIHLNYKKSILKSQKIFLLPYRSQPIHAVRELISVKCATHEKYVNTLRDKLHLCNYFHRCTVHIHDIFRVDTIKCIDFTCYLNIVSMIYTNQVKSFVHYFLLHVSTHLCVIIREYLLFLAKITVS
jgi:hypothetical protein